MKRKRKKIKYISPPMKFNLVTDKFEPDLSFLGAVEEKISIGWFWVILLIILTVIFMTALAYFIR